MSRQVESLNRSLSYPTNLQPHDSLIVFSDLNVSPWPSFSSNSSRMDSDDSKQTVFNTISNFINSEVETPDEFVDSSNETDVPSPITDDQLEFDLDEYMAHQYHFHSTNISSTIHQLSNSVSTPNPLPLLCSHCHQHAHTEFLWNKNTLKLHHHS